MTCHNERVSVRNAVSWEIQLKQNVIPIGYWDFSIITLTLSTIECKGYSTKTWIGKICLSVTFNQLNVSVFPCKSFALTNTFMKINHDKYWVS